MGRVRGRRVNSYEVEGAGYTVTVNAATVKTAITRGVQSIDRARKRARKANMRKCGLDATMRRMHTRKFTFSVELLAEDV